ncbi:MAG: DNA translocase FtsK [Lachnospiraceae bacterium]|nr:DNA translocase FtsK [Lachnospiraceae bacterium]
MANAGNHKNTGHSNGPSKQAGKAQGGRSKAVSDKELREKIAIAVFVILMLLLFLCNFGLIGTVGDAVSGFLFGVFGLLAYITPPAIVAIFFIYRKFKHNGDAIKLMAASIGMYFLIAIICDMVSQTGVGMESYSFTELYKRGAAGRCGGGLISGSIAYGIHKALGYAGLVIILILGIFLLLVVLTQGRLIVGIQKIYHSLADDHDIRASKREERRRAEAQNRDTRLIEDRHGRRDDVANDEGLLRNKKPIPAPGFNENAVTGIVEYEEGAEIEQPVERENKLTLKEKRDIQRAQRQLEKQEKQKAKAEEKEVKSILKIVPPNEQYAVPSQYKQDMHEVHYDENVQSAYTDDYSSNKNVYYDENVTQVSDNSMSGHGYPTDMPRKATETSYTEYNGIEGSAARNPLQKVRIKKQELRSEHNVNVNEEFSPLSDEGYNNYDLNQFEEETQESVNDNHSNNDIHNDSFDVKSSDIREDISRNDAFERTEEARTESPKTDTVQTESVKPEPVNTDNEEKPAYSNKKYVFPPLSLLKPGKGGLKADRNQLADTAARLQETLRSFGVNVKVDNYVQGPAVTRFEMTLEPGTKVSKILSLADDIKYSLASADVRIEAPIPGKSAVGIEVPNKENSAVSLRTLLEAKEYTESKSTLSFAVGMNIGGEVIVSDIAKMPHVLIAGATGSGKSVCINTLIMSLLYKSTPEEVQMILIDPKVVELSVYNGIPHLLLPVVTDPKKAAGALAWGVKEMEERYKKFADLGVRDLKGYNEKVETMENPDPTHFKLPKIIIIIDELADLMMTCGKEVEAAICRLAQLARACGIHLVVATQRPSVDVITGLIKANMPSRMAFAVSQGVDSRTILDTVGAEKLLGKGDMLFYPQGKAKPERVQGAFVSDEEVADVVDFLKKQRLYNFYAENSNITLDSAEDSSASSENGGKGNSQGGNGEGNGRDELYAEAGRCVINTGKGSIGFLQRKFQIGFNRAARIMDMLAEDGVVGGESGTKAREILMTIEEFEAFLDDNGI